MPGMEAVEKAAPAIGVMAEEIRAVAGEGRTGAETGEAVAEIVGGYIGRPDLLHPENREGDPSGYRQHTVHVEEDGSFSIACLVWLPGQVTPIHDHVSWCVVGVHEGEETEERFRIEKINGESVLVPDGGSVAPEGNVVRLSPPGDIHRVRNSGNDKTISIHVYGADISVLGTSIRRCYDLPVAE